MQVYTLSQQPILQLLVPYPYNQAEMQHNEGKNTVHVLVDPYKQIDEDLCLYYQEMGLFCPAYGNLL
jgi:hypothetical protein